MRCAIARKTESELSLRTFLLIAAGVYLLFQFIVGWRRGVARCFMRLAALVAAYYVGVYFGALAVPFLRGMFPYPDLVIMCVAGGIAGVLVYFVIWLVSVIFLKKTSHQKSGAIRFLYGAGGGFFGGVYGMLIIWGVISLVRAFGSYAESRIDVAKTTNPEMPPPVLESQMVNLKKALEGGFSGKMVQKVDLVPTSIYELIVKSGQITADPEALERFGQNPSVQRLLQTPRMAAILNDPEVAKAATEKNILLLMRNKNIVAAVNDPEFRNTIEKFDFIGALDQALKPPPPQKTPATSPAP